MATYGKAVHHIPNQPLLNGRDMPLSTLNEMGHEFDLFGVSYKTSKRIPPLAFVQYANVSGTLEVIGADGTKPIVGICTKSNIMFKYNEEVTQDIQNHLYLNDDYMVTIQDLVSTKGRLRLNLWTTAALVAGDYVIPTATSGTPDLYEVAGTGSWLPKVVKATPAAGVRNYPIGVVLESASANSIVKVQVLPNLDIIGA